MYFPGFPGDADDESGTVKVLAVSSAVRPGRAGAPDRRRGRPALRISTSPCGRASSPQGHAAGGDRAAEPQINAILADPADAAEADRRRRQCGVAVDRANSPAFVQAEAEKYQRIIKLTGVKAE